MWRLTRLLLLSWLLALSVWVFASDDALQVSYGHEEDSRVSATGMAGLRVRVMRDHFTFPLAMRKTPSGYWFVGGHAAQTLLTFHGSNVGERRLYRLSVPMDYIHLPARLSRWSFTGRLEPAHYTDERLFDKRASQVEYRARFSWEASQKLAWVLGVQADRRLGRAKYYPLIGAQWQPHPRLFHHWVFPDWRSELRLQRRTMLHIHLRPQGGQWRYGKYDSHENMYYVNWAIGIGMKRRLNNPFTLKVELGKNIYRKLIYNAGSTTLNDSTYWQVSLESRLGE